MLLKRSTYYVILAILISMIYGSCGADDGADEKSGDHFILSFVLEDFDPAIQGTINEVNKTVTLIIPFGTDVSGLQPTIDISAEASITPASGQAVDFTSPQTYTVTAQDGSTNDYTVTATLLPNAESRVLSFTFNDLTPAVSAHIDDDNNLISFNLAPGTSPFQLSPTITLSENASISPQSNEAMDFDQPQTYTVTAEDGSVKEYNTNLVITQRALNEKPEPPTRLCLYFGYPGQVNGSDGDPSKAKEVFKKFDIVVFGHGLWAVSNRGHANTKEIIRLLKEEKPDIKIFGYTNIGLGVLGQNLSQAQLEQSIDGWKAIGADGVFADKFGSDHEVTITRQNTFIDYAHDQGMAVFANSSVVTDALNQQTHLNGLFGDYYLLEDFLVWEGHFTDFQAHVKKAHEAYYYSKLLGVKIAVVSTELPWNLNAQSNQTDQFNLGWYATAMFNFHAFQYTDTYYGTNSRPLYLYPNPVIDYGSSWLDHDWTRKISNNRYERRTDTHTLFIEGSEKSGLGGYY